jgi:hypothetical protein
MIIGNSYGTCGYWRVQATLARQSESSGPELVCVLVRQLGLDPRQPRRW